MTLSDSTSQTQKSAIVVGAGLSGLASARVLANRGFHVTVLEQAERIGGAIRTERIAGYLCEAGPNSMLVKSAEVQQWLIDLGLSEPIVEANPAANKRFLIKNGKMVALPMSLSGGVRTPLYTMGQKLRLLKEPWVMPSGAEDESVADFVTRRLGGAFLDYGISALVSGIYAGDPQQLSIRHAFPKVWRLEKNYGSLIRGAIRLKRERRKLATPAFKNRLISFQDGLQSLVQALSRHPQIHIHTHARVTRIEQAEAGWQVAWQSLVPDCASEASANVVTAPKLVVATPWAALPRLPWAENAREAMLSMPDLPHPPLSTLVLGFDRKQIAHPLDGFGALFPFKENRFCLGAIFSSTLFPNRAPAGKVALMCFIGGMTQPDNARLATSLLVQSTVADLRPLLGITGQPEFHQHTFWPAAIPQYNVGHQRVLDQLSQLEAAFPGLSVRGNFRGGPGLHDCLQSALDWGQTL